MAKKKKISFLRYIFAPTDVSPLYIYKGMQIALFVAMTMILLDLVTLNLEKGGVKEPYLMLYKLGVLFVLFVFSVIYHRYILYRKLKGKWK